MDRQLQALDSRLTALEFRLKFEGGGRFTPVADPSCTGSAVRADLGSAAALPQLVTGRIAQAVAYMHAYRVLLENGRPPTWCTPLLPSTSVLPGTRSLVGYRPGDAVVCLLHPQLKRGWILGSIPPAMTDPARARSDAIHQASRCGLRVDRAHRALFGLGGAGGAVDWSAWRPFDGLPGLESGAIAETGVRACVDPFLAQLAVDEATGVFAFYPDQLLRVCGVNLQEFSGGHEREALTDEAECLEYHGRCVWPFEQLGATAPGLELFRDFDSEQAQLTEPHYSALEPASDRQRPFHRRVDLGGYAGQGGKRLIVGPPATPTVLTYDGGEDAGEPPVLPGLFDEQLDLHGGYTVQSAHSLLFVKRLGIPAPRRRRRPEDPAGDSGANYRSGGIDAGDSDAPEHAVRAALAPADPARPEQAALAGLLDTIAYDCSFEGVHALHYHAGDWEVPEADQGPLPAAEPVPDYAALAELPGLPPPEPRTLAVDHRYGAVPYTPGVAAFGILPDGSIALSSSGGAEIILSADGNIYLRCPGDVVTQPGRNAITLAGRDAVVRARSCVDLSAAEGDLRAKAERNLHVLAGNSGEGGILLESRGAPAYDYADKQGTDVTSGGIQLKATAGDIAAYADGPMYLRSGGSLTLDAAQGGAALVTHASSAERYLAGGATDYFGARGETEGVNHYSASSNVLGAPTAVDGAAVLLGGAIVEGNLDVVSGHVATELAENYEGAVATLAPASLDIIRSAADAARSAKKAAVADGKEAGPLADVYDDGGPGASETVEAVGFSFRTDEQYRTAGASIWEARWQQVARLSGRVPKTWVEPPVASGSAQTMPYPGREAWAQDPRFLQQDLALYDVTEGRPRGRGDSAYRDATLKAPTPAVADGNYPVIP